VCGGAYKFNAIQYLNFMAHEINSLINGGSFLCVCVRASMLLVVVVVGENSKNNNKKETAEEEGAGRRRRRRRRRRLFHLINTEYE
jgi:hypothetical protein